jgi:hypothetical protein
MPLPIMRTAFFYADEDELPTVTLKKALPRRGVSFKDVYSHYPSTPREIYTPPREMSPLTELSDHESDDATPEEIPKPPGEPGRPDSGGYNLQQAVNWTSSDFNRLKVRLQILHLGLM